MLKTILVPEFSSMIIMLYHSVHLCVNMQQQKRCIHPVFNGSKDGVNVYGWCRMNGCLWSRKINDQKVLVSIQRKNKFSWRAVHLASSCFHSNDTHTIHFSMFTPYLTFWILQDLLDICCPTSVFAAVRLFFAQTILVMHFIIIKLKAIFTSFQANFSVKGFKGLINRSYI